MSPSREFDLVLFGATGYTGRLIAQHLGSRAGPGISWAVAGRSAGSLRQLGREVGHPAAVLADAADPDSLRAMVRRAKVVVSAVGPYALHGSELVKACAETGTDYVDLSGEWPWMKEMIAHHEAAAQRSGARIVFSSGFDSLPFELGTQFLQDLAFERFGRALAHVKARVRFIGGGFSTATVASFRRMIQGLPEGLEGWWKADAFALTPGWRGFEQPVHDRVVYDHDMGAWLAPSVFVPINRANLHRANLKTSLRWGWDFTYEEMMFAGPGAEGESLARQIAAMNQLLAYGHEPWVSPDEATRENSAFEIHFEGRGPQSTTLKVLLAGRRDPGYGATSRMVGEVALALLQLDGPRHGGMWTPGSLLGARLRGPLAQHADITLAEVTSGMGRQAAVVP